MKFDIWYYDLLLSVGRYRCIKGNSLNECVARDTG